MPENKEYKQDSTGKYTPKPLQGLGALPKEEQDKIIQGFLDEGKLPRSYSFDQADRIWKNRQFRKKYGDDVYAKITDKSSPNYMPAEVRDELFDREEYSKAIEDRFKDDPNLDFYRGMTTESLKDLWDSDIKSADEIEAEEERLNKLRKSNPENTYKPQSRLAAIFQNANEGLDADGRPLQQTGLGDVAEMLRLNRGLLQGEEKEKAERKAAAVAQKAKNAKEGTVTAGADDEVVDQMISQLRSSNAKHIEELRMREDERIINLPGVQEAANARANQLRARINSGEKSLEDVVKVYHQVFDNDEKDDMSGSRYYTGYKNKSEFSKFDVDDMIQSLAEFDILSDAFGDQSRAMQVMDTKMFNYAKNNQSFVKRRWNVLRGVGAKANSMLMNELFGGALDMGHAIFERDHEAYRQYKTAENVLGKKGIGFLFNPNYWNYVDQYAVWNPNEIKRINDNGGVGGNVNLYSPDGKMTLEQFADEGFKMLGYMLPGVLLSAATKKVPRGSGWAKLITGWEIGGSALSLGSAYSSGVYNDITLKGEQALDKMFDAESADYIKEYYRTHPEYIDNYFKERGIKRDDSDLLTLPTQMAAQRQFYEDAKADYFEKNEERKAAYEHAHNRLLRDAHLGATVDNLIETGRMLVSGSFWGKWTKSKLTRDVLNKGYNPIIVTGEDISQASRGALRRKAAAATLLGGGVDNWLDDITAGVGKGLGLGIYNNYLGSVYGPDATIKGDEFASNFLDGMLYGMEGAREAFYTPQTWIDGALGAVGSVFGTRINALTLIRDAVKRDGIFSPKNAEEGTAGADARKKWNELSKLQKWDRYVTNGVMTSMADVDAKYQATNEYIEKLKTDIIPKYKDEIRKAGEVLSETFDYNLMADSIMEGKDIKQIGMLKSVIRMLDGMKDPILSQIPEVQKFTDLLNRGRNGNFTYDEIQTFINDPANTEIKNAVDQEGNSISEQLAVEAMQKNVNSLLKIADTYTKFSKGLAKNEKFSVLNPEAKAHIAVQLTLRDLWQERLESMQDALGTRGTEKARWSYEAEFGTANGRERTIKALESEVNKYREDLRNRRNAQGIAADVINRVTDEEGREVAYKNYLAAKFLADYTADALKENEQTLREKRRARVSFDEEGNARVLSAEEIMHLSPKQRAKMLDPANRSMYSAEQVRVIEQLSDNLKNNIDSEGRSQDLLQVALDAGKIQERIEGSDFSIKAASRNPYMVRLYAQRLQERQSAMLAQAAIEATRQEQLEKLGTITNSQEAVDVIFRGKHPANTADKGFYIPADVVKEYTDKHPESESMFAEARSMVATLDDLYFAAEELFSPVEAEQIKSTIAKATRETNSKEEMISAVESLMDAQTSPEAKLQYDRVLEKMKSYGYQRDATKVRDRDLERQRKREAEAQRQTEEAKLDGKNYELEGFRVGDTVYNKDSGTAATVVGFERTKEGANKVTLEVKYGDGTRGLFTYNASTAKEKLSKEPPKPKEDAPVPAPAETKPTRKGDKQIKKALERLEKATTPEEKAQAISDYETNKYHGAEVTAEEEAKIKQAKEELAKEGYEVVDLLGKPYHTGMKVSASFREDSTLNPGEEIITAVTKPQINKNGEMVQAAHIVVSQNSATPTNLVDINLDIDSNGETESPTAEQQAAATGSTVVKVPTSDVTDQGNVINTDSNGVLPGNRWVEYSIEKLKDGVVEREEPRDKNNVFGQLRAWLDKTGTKLQEIIDEEFSRILQDNPDVEIRFMMMRKDSGTDKLSGILFNVVELTAGMRQKYHSDSRGGVIQANGKEWLVVGTTGFESNTTQERRNSFDANTKGPISKRRYSYFDSHPNERYYVDDIAYSRVQNTTSGRIVNQRLGETESHLQRVSDLLKSAGMSLKKAFFGIQTNEAGDKSFATTKNFKERDRLYPPRNVEDNRGRTFVLIQTTNGNWIPGMIEPAMYNSLADDSPLKTFIDSTIAKLFSTNYETRKKGISELRSYLLLKKDGKNILVGNKDINNITIKVPGMPDITQSLGPKFDALKFFSDLKNANFQLNITLDSLNDADFLKMYDESNALMTSVASMRTAGMSYTIYPTDKSGKPIISAPTGNSAPGLGRTDNRTYRSVRVNNGTYEFKEGVFIDRNTKKPVPENTHLWWSCQYNLWIKEGGWVPFTTSKGKEYYNVQGQDGKVFVITRDGLGNIEFLDQETSDRLNNTLQQQYERQQRENNLEEVNLYDDVTPEPAKPAETPAEVSQDEINRHLVGDFSRAPETKAETPAAQTEDVATKPQEITSQQPKEVISSVGNKSLEELQKTENLSTFAEVAADSKYGDMLYDILDKKGWGITGDFATDAEILKKHKISVVGITNIEDWLKLIEECK